MERLVSHSLNFKLLASIRVWIYQRIEPLAPGGLLDQMGGDLLENMIEDVDILENFYIRAVSPPLVALLVLAGASLFIGRFTWEGGWVLFGGLAISAILIPIATYFLSQSVGRKIVGLKAEINSSLVENLQGMDDLMVYGHAADMLDQMDSLSKRLGSAQMIQSVGSGLANGANLLATQVTLWTALYFCIPLVRNGKLDGVLLAVISLVILASFEATIPLAAAAQNLENSLTGANRILATTGLSPLVVDVEKPLEIRGERVELQFDGVWFRYHSQADWALRNVNFCVRPGRRTALVGPSGSGKTSLAQLVLRFYPPDRGRICVNGVDVCSLKQEEIRKRITLVSQTAYFFNQSLRNNLLLANPACDDARLRETIDQVGMGSWLADQVEGLNTQLGERGAFLSGGERQRLSLARALLQDTDLIIFDEPTSNLDAITARDLMPSLLNIAEGKSVLWITHNLVGLDIMDEILVLKEGQIVEHGRYDQLIKGDGVYAKMWKIQHELI